MKNFKKTMFTIIVIALTCVTCQSLAAAEEQPIEQEEALADGHEDTMLGLYNGAEETGGEGAIDSNEGESYGQEQRSLMKDESGYEENLSHQSEKYSSNNERSQDSLEGMSGTWGYNLKWVLDDQMTLTISGEGEMDNFDYDELDAWRSKEIIEAIKKVVIKEGVTSISDRAFCECKGLTEAEIPDSVVEIGDFAFGGTILETLDIPASVTSFGIGVFDVSKNLLSINVAPENEILTSENGVLYDKEKKTLIKYPCRKSDTSYNIPVGVEAISHYAFEHSSNLKEIVIPDSVTEINWAAFWECTGLTNIKIPHAVECIPKELFYGCSSLMNVDLPDYITSLGSDSFAWCTSLTDIKLPDSLTYLGENAFQECNSLKSVVIPSLITKIQRGTFENCTSLTNITIPKSVTEIEAVELFGEGVFEGCSSMQAFNVEPGNEFYASEDGILYDKNKTQLIKYPSKKSGNAFIISNTVTKIWNRAFEECVLLKEITIPNSVKGIGTAAFENCSSLAGITIPNGITTIYKDTFQGCSGLLDIALPDSLKYISDNAFFSCSSLKRIVIPGSVTEISRWAFAYCDALETIWFKGNAPSFEPSDYYGVFKDVTATAYYPSNNKTWTKSVLKDYGGKITWKAGEPDSAKTEKKVSKIKISGVSKKVAAGKKIKLSVKVTPSDASNKKIEWKSSNKKVAKVTSSGVVTMQKKSGGKSVTITATAMDGSGQKATWKLTSMKGIVKKIEILGKKSVKAGRSLKLKAKVQATKKANTKIKWTSSNKKYASVNTKGKVKTYRAGKGKTVRITAAATDGSNKKKSVTIKIK